MTQKRLAELSGVCSATINYIKGGKRCTDEVGKKIAKALGVTVEETMTWNSAGRCGRILPVSMKMTF